MPYSTQPNAAGTNHGYALPIRDCRTRPNRTPTRLYATGRSMTAERHRSAPILDLLRQAYPRLPNLSFAGQAYTEPNLPIRDCLTSPGLSSPCQASPNPDCPALPCIACTRRTETCQDCHNKPHASGTSPTVHCRAPPRLPNTASPSRAKRRRTEPIRTPP